jgi:hypothetical protein
MTPFPLRLSLLLSIRPVKGSINLANTDFDVGFFEVIKIFSNPTPKSSLNCPIFDYLAIILKINLSSPLCFALQQELLIEL